MVLHVAGDRPFLGQFVDKGRLGCATGITRKDRTRRGRYLFRYGHLRRH